MSRNISHRIEVEGTLRALAPLHVGGAAAGPDADMMLAVDGQGNFYVPGTSLAGALRQWVCDRVGGIPEQGRSTLQTAARNMWGYQPNSEEQAKLPDKDKDKDKDKDSGWASQVLIEDARVKSAIPPEVREGVGIDRFAGVAAAGIKYNRMVLPRGTELSFELLLQLNGQYSDQQEALLADLMEALEQGRIRLGAATTRGLGRIALVGASARKHNLRSRQGMLGRLKAAAGASKAGSLFDYPGVARRASGLLKRVPRLVISLEWKAEGPVMSKAEGSGIGVDILPLVSADGDRLRFTLPGSSVKGALRAKAEQIVRTVIYRTRPPNANDRERFLEALDVPLVNELFGARKRTRARGDATAASGVKGALSVEDCMSVHAIPKKDWRSLERAGKRPGEVAAAARRFPGLDQGFHVAVDRWAGGAAHGFLYSVLEPHGIPWEPIRIEVDLSRLRPLEEPAVALLLVTLRELCKGRLPLGFGGNRGLGTIKIDLMEIEAFDLSGLDALGGLAKHTLAGGSLSGLPRELRDELTGAWTAWAAGNREGGLR